MKPRRSIALVIAAGLSLAPGTAAGHLKHRSVGMQEGPQSSGSYVSGINARRTKRDEEFRSRRWSPLAVIAIARLDRPKTSIGSAESADLRLPREAVADIHAEILREEGPGGQTTWRLRPVGGRVWTDSEPPQPVEDLVLSAGTRVRVGRFVVYMDNLGTFGAVVRALDFSAPAFTGFSGLNYFPPDARYRVEGVVAPYPQMERVLIIDSRGWQRPAWRFGEAVFTLDRKQFRLQLWVFTPEPGPKDAFFIAFSDQTSGNETYTSGRYLEPPFVPSGPITLDFNLATNPSCAYNDGFACPLTPGQNRLPAAIRAGEKTYHGGSRSGTEAGAAQPKPDVTPAGGGVPLVQAIVIPGVPARESYQPKPAAQTNLETGRLLRESGDVSGANRSFMTAVTLDPDYVDAIVDLADAVRTSRANYEGPIRPPVSPALQRIIDLYRAKAASAPMNAVYQWALGELDVSVTRDAAERFFRNAIASDPAFVKPYQSLGFTLSYRCDFDAAREMFRKAAEMKPRDPDVLADYARQVRESDPPLFQKLTNDFLASHSGHEAGADLLSRAAVFERDPAARISLLERLKVLYPPSESVTSEWYMRFLFDAYNGTDPVKALALAQEMSLIVPGGEVEKDWRGIAEYAQDMIRARSLMDRRSYVDAAKLLEKAKLPYLVSPDPLVLLNAEARAAAGDVDRAYKTAAGAMARRPSDALRPALAKYGEQLRKSPERMERDVLDLMKNNGSRLDNFTLTAYAGERKVKLSDYRGRVVLLTLWYPSCSSCREDLPYMQKTLEKYGPRGFSVITINARPWEDALATIQMRRFGFESLRVPYTDWAEMRFWIRTYPQHMLLDREGRVLFVPAFWGFEPRHDFELALEMLLDAGNR